MQGKNAARFKRNFSGTDWVQVPTVEWSLSSPKVLTLQYLPGVKITDTAGLRALGLDTKLVAQRATEAYLMQILCDSSTRACPVIPSLSAVSVLVLQTVFTLARDTSRRTYWH